jgi:tRNA threonylcarbamoyladenosine biosynthesis protein TsaB
MSPASPPLRLAIDTATDRLSVAVARGPVGPVERALHGARRHAGALLPLIDEALLALGAAPTEVAVVAVSDGPGSFTGLRVGAVVAKALAAGNGAALFTASTLLVRAAGAARGGERVLALSSALRGEVFAGLWHFGRGGAVDELFAPRALDAAGLAALPPIDRVVGEGPATLVQSFAEARRVEVVAAWPSAVTLLDLIDRPGGCRQVTDPVAWEPDYGRPAEAQVRWEHAHGRALPHSSGASG